jgi:hypothetical protein
MFTSLRKVLVTAAVGGLALGAMAVSGSAGVPQGAAPLTILKTVSGPVPAGTTFTALVQCSDPIIFDGGEGTDSATVTFDETGQPTSADTITFGDPGSCTVTETVNGGASSTTYSCVGEEPVKKADPAPVTPGSSGFGAAAIVDPEVAICPTAGPQAAPITVNIEFEDQTATVTIANTFDPITPSPAIVIQPAFTG